MAEPRMKSSWEIAMERAEKLGKPSAEEIKKRREETCVPIGQALAKKYLSGLPMRDVHIELEKYKGEDTKVVVEAFLGLLKDSLFLDQPDDADRAIEAWRLFRPSSDTDKVLREIKDLFGTYDEAKKVEEGRAIPQVEEDLLRQLEEEGIAGSAVVVNSKKSISTAKSLDNVRKDYAEKLEKLKEKL